jgi:PKD repeat protein
MKRIILLLLLQAGLLTLPLHAQTKPDILFHAPSTLTAWHPVEELSGNRDKLLGLPWQESHVCLMQTNLLPDKETQANLLAEGIRLLEYLPHHVYLVSLPINVGEELLSRSGFVAFHPLSPSMKVRQDLLRPELPSWIRSGGRIELMLKYHRHLDRPSVLEACATHGIEVLRQNSFDNFLRISVAEAQIGSIAALPWVAFLDAVPEPDVPDDVNGRAIHRSNAIDASFPGGRHYDGSGVHILVRDDGAVGPHIDFKGRIDNSLTEPQIGSHGDGVGGIMGGAGNLDPRQKGMASGSFLYVVNYEADFLDETMDLHTQQDVLVTNSSYSNGCNTGYTAITETVDQQLYLFPTLMHVFSAGNSNNTNCGYGAGNQWGNITGGHKQAKNCITTANLDADTELANSSSRGPAHDGRLKPDIAAHGQGQVSTDEGNTYQVFGGTSAAAPGIAGVMAQLHQAYRELNNGETAPAALLKAALLNGANDLGNVGPDFRFGWGHVNALRAVTVLEEQRYLWATVEAGATNTHPIQIPDGMKEARVMVYWHDPAASVMTTKALVNDLNIRLVSSDTTIHLPWVLDPTPNVNALQSPAVKGVDNLNNMEQVSIAYPVPGSYTLEVIGSEIPFGEHDYWVVWEFLEPGLTLTHPTGGESFGPSDTVRIHWDGIGISDSILVEWLDENMMPLSVVGMVPPGTTFLDWVVPADAAGHFQLRISSAGHSDQTAAPFDILARPNGLVVSSVCPDAIHIEWNPVEPISSSGPVSYEINLLGDLYMEPVDTVDTPYTSIPPINGNPFEEHWIAIRTLAEGALRSERTVAIPYQGGLLNCPQQLDALVQTILSPGSGDLEACEGTELTVRIALRNDGLQAITDLPVTYRLDDEPPVQEFLPNVAAGETLAYTFLTPLPTLDPGPHTIRVFTALPGDQFLFNDTAVHTFQLALLSVQPAITDYAEGFENPDFPPPSYTVGNADQDITWTRKTAFGANGSATAAAFVNNYDYAAFGAEDILRTVPVDLGDASLPYLSFDLAYAYYNDDYFDGLRVEIYEDCGWSFGGVLYEKFKDELATVNPQTSVFTPNSSNQWRKETIDLSAFVGKTVQLRFVNVCGYGNSLYVDNIQLFDYLPPVAGFQTSDSILCQGLPVTFTSTATGGDLSYEWDFGSGATPATGLGAGPFSVVYGQPGIVTPTLTVTNDLGFSVWESNIEVDPLPSPGFEFVLSGNTVTFDNTSLNGLGYLWDFGDGNFSLNNAPQHTYAEPGIYSVTLSATNDCGTMSVTRELDILVGTVLPAPTPGLSLAVHPNPSPSDIRLHIHSDMTADITVRLLSVTGQLLAQRSDAVRNGRQVWTFDGSGLPAGIYLVELLSAGQHITKRMVLQH